MQKTLVFTNEKDNQEIYNTTKSLIENSKLMQCSIDDLFPINVDGMVGSIKDILKKTGSYIRTSDFPNTIWIYGDKKQSPLQIEIVNEKK